MPANHRLWGSRNSGPGIVTSSRYAGSPYYFLAYQYDGLLDRWEVQHDIAELLLQIVRVSLNTACMTELKYLDSCLRLALCYHIGFGVRPNLDDTFHPVFHHMKSPKLSTSVSFMT